MMAFADSGQKVPVSTDGKVSALMSLPGRHMGEERLLTQVPYYVRQPNRCTLCTWMEMRVSMCSVTYVQFSSVAQSYLTLCNPMDCNLPGSSSMGFSRQEYYNGHELSKPWELVMDRRPVVL